MVHMGVVIMFVGFSGAAFNLDSTQEVTPGSTMKIGRYDLKVADLDKGSNDNYQWGRLTIEVSSGGSELGKLYPERRLYTAMRQPQPTSEVAIRRRPNEDLYLNFAGMSADNSKAVIQAYVFPLVSWIWAGYWVLLFGTLICLVPSKQRLVYAKTEVVGIARQAARVEN